MTDEKLTEILYVRFTGSERSKFEKIAESTGLSVSAVIRTLAVRQLKATQKGQKQKV